MNPCTVSRRAYQADKTKQIVIPPGSQISDNACPADEAGLPNFPALSAPQPASKGIIESKHAQELFLIIAFLIVLPPGSGFYQCYGFACDFNNLTRLGR